MTLAHRSVLTALAALLAAGVLAPLQAQQVYRIVGPDGKVTFSDKPPADPNVKSTSGRPGSAGTTGAAGTSAALPFELRGAMQRYPVTLYTSTNCGPCGQGRAYLSSRGIPFSERTIGSPDDIEALRRLSGDTRVPVLSIGSQQLRGFSDAEWGQYLDAANYPKTSQLPTGYRQALPTPLVAVAAPQAPQAQAPQDGTQGAADGQPQNSAPPAPAGSNPAGIKF